MLCSALEVGYSAILIGAETVGDVDFVPFCSIYILFMMSALGLSHCSSIFTSAI